MSIKTPDCWGVAATLEDRLTKNLFGKEVIVFLRQIWYSIEMQVQRPALAGLIKPASGGAELTLNQKYVFIRREL